MAEAAPTVSKDEPRNQVNLLSVLGNFFKSPFQKREPKPEEAFPITKGIEASTEKPDVVRFRHKPTETAPPPLKLEVEEESGKTSNPLILWQVYAVGGFLVLSWAWARWKERKTNKGDNDEAPDNQNSPADDDSSSYR